MSLFKTIAAIHLEHDYYTSSINSQLSLVPTPGTRALMKQRGILFIQTAPDEWQCLMEQKSAGFMEEDVLEVSLMVDDPDFMRKIIIKEYNPQTLYQIRLEKGDIVINEEFSLSSVSNEMKRQGEFCRIVLKPGQKHTIRFCSSSYYWEYLLVFRNETDLHEKQLVLETIPRNAIAFHPCKKYENSRFGNNVYQIISIEKIKLRKRYEFTLSLYEYLSDDRVRKEMSRFIPTPQPGKFLADRSDILREVCYF